MKADQTWLVTMQCRDLAASLSSCASAATAVNDVLGYKILGYHLNPPGAKRGGRRHNVEFTIRGDSERPQRCKLELQEALCPIAAEGAGREQKFPAREDAETPAKTTERMSQDASPPALP